jgi:hypothetical protein
MQRSIFSTCQYSVMRRMPPTILLHTSCCSLVEGQAHRLIAGAAWAWRAYLGDYKKNPVVPLRLSAFGSDHGLPQERFAAIIFGADHIVRRI